MKIPQEAIIGLEAEFKRIKGAYGIPGMAFSVVEGDTIVYSTGLGFKNKEKQLPCSADTVFAIGSSSKPFAALSILQLVEQGKVKLNDPIDKYVNVKWGRKYGDDNPITIHHLLSQTGGLSDMGLAKILTAVQHAGSNYDPELEKYDLSTNDLYIEHINGASDFINPPGRYSYCNTNFTLAHIIVENVTGQLYDDYAKEHIFTPCEMSHTTLKGEAYKQFEDRMMGYLVQKEGDQWKTDPVDFINPPIIMGCGGLYSNVKDLGNFIITMMNGGKFKEKSVLNPSLMEKFFKFNTYVSEFDEIGIKGMGSKKGEGGYAYGWFVIDDFLENHKVVTHPGSVVVSSSVVLFMPDLNLGFAILWNGGEEAFGDLIFAILGAVATLLGKDPMQEFGIVKEGMRLQKLCGTYYDYIRKHPAEITMQGSDLYIEWPGARPKMPLHPFDKEGNCMKYYTKTSPTGFDLAEFIFEEGDRVRLLIEKHTLLKNN